MDEKARKLRAFSAKGWFNSVAPGVRKRTQTSALPDVASAMPHRPLDTRSPIPALRRIAVLVVNGCGQDHSWRRSRGLVMLLALAVVAVSAVPASAAGPLGAVGEATKPTS